MLSISDTLRASISFSFFTFFLSAQGFVSSLIEIWRVSFSEAISDYSVGMNLFIV